MTGIVSKFLIIICVVCSLCSCAHTKKNAADELQHGMLQVSYLSQRYGTVEEPGVKEYVAYIGQRLSKALTEGGRFPYEFVFLNTVQPMAISPGAGFIVFSKGVVSSVRSEAELAFVLAHEIAHVELGHTALLDSNPELSTQEQREMEIAADKFAVGLIALAGYDPRISAHALLHTYEELRHAQLQSTHPDLEFRLRAIQDQIISSGWRPPGTVDRWDFRRFRAIAMR